MKQKEIVNHGVHRELLCGLTTKRFLKEQTTQRIISNNTEKPVVQLFPAGPGDKVTGRVCLIRIIGRRIIVRVRRGGSINSA